MATQISINALNNPQNLITGTGLTNFVVLAQTVRDFVIDPNFGSLLSQAGTGSIPAAAVRPLPGNKIQTAVLSGSNFTGGQIARRSITEQDIADNGIVSRNISNNAVTNEKINNVDGGKIASGTVAADRIANLDAAKTTSGVFDAARIPNLDSSKITGGTLDTTRIPNLDASKITSGTLPVERGGTGQTSIAGIRTSLNIDGIANTSNQSSINFIATIYPNRIGPRYTTWSGVGDGGAGILNSNEEIYKALMIVGSDQQTGLGRVVKVWDYLYVQGSLAATGDIIGFNTSDIRLKNNVLENNIYSFFF